MAVDLDVCMLLYYCTQGRRNYLVLVGQFDAIPLKFAHVPWLQLYAGNSRYNETRY
jgi:hypothetical protein